jgi:hypothetical protein
MFIFYAIPALCLLAVVSAIVIDTIEAARRRPRPLSPFEVRQRLRAHGRRPYDWATADENLGSWDESGTDEIACPPSCLDCGGEIEPPRLRLGSVSCAGCGRC